MRDPQWETAARLRYLDDPNSEPDLQCVCGATLRNEEFCVHALDCKKVKGKTQASRHNEVKESFTDLLAHYGWIVLVNVRVVNPLTPSYVDREAAERSHTLSMDEANKRNTHDKMALVRGMELDPLAFTTYEIPGPETLNFLNKVARAHASDKELLVPPRGKWVRSVC